MLPSKNTARLLDLTLTLIDDHAEGFEQWCHLIDQGACVHTTVHISDAMKVRGEIRDLNMTPLEIVLSCWSWGRVAQALEALPPLCDVYFKNLSQLPKRHNIQFKNSVLSSALFTWQGVAQRGLHHIPYGEWGIWETLMYREWVNCDDLSLVTVMRALQKLPKIDSLVTLENMAKVATMGNTTTLEMGGMMALMVGIDPQLRSSDAYKKLVDLAVNDEMLRDNWTNVQEAYSAIQHATISTAVTAQGRDTVARKM